MEDLACLDAALQDPDDVILDFAESRVLDHSALEAGSHT